MNPKALSLGELYGEYDLSTNEWTDGILSSVMRAACAGTQGVGWASADVSSSRESGGPGDRKAPAKMGGEGEREVSWFPYPLPALR